MPLYSYECKDCGKVDDFADTMTTDRAPHYPCSVCNGISKRLYGLPQVAIFTAYQTPHFDGVMREVRTASQENELCRANNCSRLLDTDRFDTAKSAKRRQAAAEKVLPTMEESYLEVKHEMGLGAETTVDDLPGSRRMKPELAGSTIP